MNGVLSEAIRNGIVLISGNAYCTKIAKVIAYHVHYRTTKDIIIMTKCIQFYQKFDNRSYEFAIGKREGADSVICAWGI